MVLGDVLFIILPGSSINNPAPMHITIAALPALAGFLGGGMAWGSTMAGIAGSTDKRWMAWAGLLGFGPITPKLKEMRNHAQAYHVQ